MTETTPRPTTRGILHNAVGYDFLVWLLHGGERAFREDVIRLADLAPGESVLDVGCGTGTLAIAAKQKVGSTGSVYAIDASPEMLARARAKAKRRRLDIAFQNAAAEALPFPDKRFDVVLSTIMLHHLPRKVRLAAASEIRRVVKPGGRVVIVEFQESGKGSHRHGHVTLDDMLTVLSEAGLEITHRGQFKKPNLYYVLATAQEE